MLLAGTRTIKSHLEKYLDNVSLNQDVVVVTRKNKENVIMISEKEYNELLAKKEKQSNYVLINKYCHVM